MRRAAPALAAGLLCLWLWASPAGAASGPPASVATNEETVLSLKNGQIHFFDQVSLQAPSTVTWPVAFGAKGISVEGATLVNRGPDWVELKSAGQGAFILTYSVPLDGESFIWVRTVTTVPENWVVLVGPGLRPGFTSGLPFRVAGSVRIAGQNLKEYVATGVHSGQSLAWPFEASAWPQILSQGAIWAIYLLLALGALQTWRSVRGRRVY